MKNTLFNAQQQVVPFRPNLDGPERALYVDKAMQALKSSKDCVFSESEQAAVQAVFTQHYSENCDLLMMRDALKQTGFEVAGKHMGGMQDLIRHINVALMRAQSAWFERFQPVPAFAVGDELMVHDCELGEAQGTIESIEEGTYTVKIKEREGWWARMAVAFEDAREWPLPF